jgi:hypothetical protein
LAPIQHGTEHPRLRADRQRLTIGLEAARQDNEAARAILFREGLGTPCRSAAVCPRPDPDLEDSRDLWLKIELSVLNTGARAHHLNVAGGDAIRIP